MCCGENLGRIEMLEEILIFIKQKQAPVRRKDIMGEFGIGRGSVHNWLTRLLDKGLVTRTINGYIIKSKEKQ